MLACACPNCGAPSPISLATTCIQCASCGQQAPPPADVAEQLQAAGLVVREHDVRERQLSQQQRRLVTSTWLSGGCFVAMALLVGGPFFLLAVWATLGFLRSTGAHWLMLVFFIIPVVLVGVAVVLLSLWLRKKRGALALACTAVPPSVSGGTANCHVCGAPLERSTEAVVRCGYCQADNLVSPAALARATRERVVVLEGFVDAVRTRATSLRASSGWASAGVASIGCLAPIIAIVALIAGTMILDEFETELSDKDQYTVVDVPQGRCVAKVTRVAGSVRISYGAREEDGAIPSEDRPSAEGLALWDIRRLRGRRVLVYDKKVQGTVTRLHGTLADITWVVIRADSGAELKHLPAGLCLLDDEGDATDGPAG